MENENLNLHYNDKSSSQHNFGKYIDSWFIISVIVTVILIIILAWSLISSYNTVRSFEERELVLERYSSDLMLAITHLETSARLAASTGNLTWQDNYQQHKDNLMKTLDNIKNLLATPDFTEEANIITDNLNTVQEIEAEAFALISEGRREEAAELLRGWNYVNNQRELETTLESLTANIQEQIQGEVIAARNQTGILLAIVFAAFIILIISWTVSLQNIKDNYNKRREKEKEITYLSYHDSLTELYNRRYFMKVGEKIIKELTPQRENLTLMMIDIDHFKKVNDTYGHAGGDVVLQKLAVLLKNNIRNSDIPARLGGEEFGVLLPGASLESAREISERLRKSIEDNPTEFEGQKISITISIGLAEYQKDIPGIDELLQNADEALYQAKESGRNCIICCQNLAT